LPFKFNLYHYFAGINATRKVLSAQSLAFYLSEASR
jgi:hypothetical protein